ncbi:MAG: amidohydrolase [Proteobacteria bacterium]|nr:amidohydrolase [Pseudomonadota bacterium]
MKTFSLILLVLLNPGSASAQPHDATDLHARIDALAGDMEEQVIVWRRDVHTHPELSNREFRTSKLVAEHLRSLGMEVQTGIAHTGVVGILKGRGPGPVVALRADMDGLPVKETTGLAYASTEVGIYEGQEVSVMHACGHDNHVAILMGAASVLSDLRDQFDGTIKFIFQPAEEGAPKGEKGGAGMMIEEGVLKSPDVDAVFGLHISQNGLAGTANYRSGGAMASAQRFDIEIHGRQTHGARPWAGVDPIVIGAQIITALQTIVARQVDVTSAPAVVTVATFHGGIRNNIIPDKAVMSGTIRTFDPDMREFIHQQIHKITESIAGAMGATVSVTIDPGVPVTHNDPALTARMIPSLQRIYGPTGLHTAERITGAEDFSFYQEEVPGLFFFIGARPADIPPEKAIPNHSPYFYIDEAALLPGVRAMSSLAIDYLQSTQPQ